MGKFSLTAGSRGETISGHWLSSDVTIMTDLSVGLSSTMLSKRLWWLWWQAEGIVGCSTGPSRAGGDKHTTAVAAWTMMQAAKVLGSSPICPSCLSASPAVPDFLCLNLRSQSERRGKRVVGLHYEGEKMFFCCFWAVLFINRWFLLVGGAGDVPRGSFPVCSSNSRGMWEKLKSFF